MPWYIQHLTYRKIYIHYLCFYNLCFVVDFFFVYQVISLWSNNCMKHTCWNFKDPYLKYFSLENICISTSQIPVPMPTWNNFIASLIFGFQFANLCREYTFSHRPIWQQAYGDTFECNVINIVNSESYQGQAAFILGFLWCH